MDIYNWEFTDLVQPAFWREVQIFQTPSQTVEVDLWSSIPQAVQILYFHNDDQFFYYWYQLLSTDDIHSFEELVFETNNIQALESFIINNSKYPIALTYAEQEFAKHDENENPTESVTEYLTSLHTADLNSGVMLYVGKDIILMCSTNLKAIHVAYIQLLAIGYQYSTISMVDNFKIYQFKISNIPLFLSLS